MRRLLLLFSFLLFLYVSWGVFEKHNNNFVVNHPSIESIKTEIEKLHDSPVLANVVTSITKGLSNLLHQLDPLKEKLQQQQTETPSVNKPKLKIPTEQIFSVHNIQIGDSRVQVEKQLGSPKNSSLNEFGLEWHAYHQNYQNFIMVGYDQTDIVVGLYTNQDLISSTKNITYGSEKGYVTNVLGNPLKSIHKGLVYYQLENKEEYAVYLLDNSYVSIFYDIHQGNMLTAIQIISKNIEDKRIDFYTSASVSLKEGFEQQLFDLTNASRVNHGLRILAWDEEVSKTAWKHSLDMAQNNYFSHTNLEGQSPFDRMLADNISFSMAGENLAYGQFSSVFAHEGLMNSLGHRKNILQADFSNLGVGVAFNEESQPYYTEKFFSN